MTQTLVNTNMISELKIMQRSPGNLNTCVKQSLIEETCFIASSLPQRSRRNLAQSAAAFPHCRKKSQNFGEINIC